ncbi:MAG: CPBP family intramembrane metalloprotease [Bacteroidales bacterium]|nr:CPBP family intramembrane metalloprotease [Bacteroidales bacterium]
MNTKKLIVFLLWAFIPMVVVGLVMHFGAVYPGGQSDDVIDSAPTAALRGLVFSAGAMLIPLLAVIFTRLIFREPILKGLGISFKINRWWWIGWLLMPVIALAVLGVTLLMPGAKWTPDSVMMRQAMQSMPEEIGVWGVLGISLLSGLFQGATFNAVFAFGEEIAWRGFLVKEFKGKKFLTAALWIGIIWGFWHAPLILNGHNYPRHPVAGVLMMVIFCLLLTPMLMYFRQKSGSVIVPAIMHGTFNAVVGVSAVVITPANDLLYGGPGLAGFIVLLAVNTCLYLYDKYIIKENIFTTRL